MFEKSINILAECCKSAVEKMTGFKVEDVKFNKEEGVSEKYSVVHVIPYEKLHESVTGDFMLGFEDEQGAVLVASAIAAKMGLPAVEQFDAKAADVIGEFMNTVVGNAISTWDMINLSVKFGHPEMERDREISVSDDSMLEAYHIVLNIGDGGDDNESGQVVITGAFSMKSENYLQDKKILVVDDSELVRQYLAKALDEAGVKVETAVDGMDGVEKHKTFKPDLTVMDLVMPVMEGLDAITKIRKTAPEAKFIILTSSARKDEVLKARDLNVMDYIIKPMEMDQFLVKVTKVFK